MRATRHVVVPCGDRLLVLANLDTVDAPDPAADTPDPAVDVPSDPTADIERDVLAVAGTLGAFAFEELDAGGELRSVRREMEERRRDRNRLESVLSCRNRIDRFLGGRRSREELEDRVCRELGSLDGVALAWIGEVSAEEVTARSWAGRMDGYVDAARPSPDTNGGEPAGVAAARFESVVHEDLPGEREPSAPIERWRREALDRSFQSVYSVPIVYGEFRYGVLSLYGTRPGVFDEAFRRALGPIGRVVGTALHEVERERVEAGAAVTELEVLVDAREDPLARLVDRIDGRVDVDVVVPGSDARTVLVGSVETDSDVDLTEAIRSTESIDVLGGLDHPSDTHTFEITNAPSSIVRTVATHGGRVRSLVATDGPRTQVLIEVPETTDVRSFVTMLERTYADVELLARRSREQSPITGTTFVRRLSDRLTERQLRTLQVAYYSGYFESPRECTGQEVAERLEVSQPTFNRHFRAAERGLFSLLFDEYVE